MAQVCGSDMTPCFSAEEQTLVFNSIIEVFENIHNARKNRAISNHEEDPYKLHTLLLEGRFIEAYIALRVVEDIDVDLKFTNKFTHYQEVTILHLAVKSNQLRIAKTILEIDPLIIDVQDFYGFTPLHIAVDFGHVEIINILFEYCADVNAKNKDGQTPLHVAAYRNEVKIAELLLKNGACVSLEDNEGGSPLHYAAYKGCPDIIKLLIDYGADVNGYTKYFTFNLLKYPMHWAALSGTILPLQKLDHNFSTCSPNQANKIEGMEILLKHEAKMNYKEELVSPLHVAVTSKNNYSDVIHFMILNGANIESCDADGSTPLHRAVYIGIESSVLNLLRSGADVDARDKYDNTPLHLVAETGSLEYAQVLVAFQADSTLKNVCGETPAMIAGQYGHLVLMNYLISVSDSSNCRIT